MSHVQFSRPSRHRIYILKHPTHLSLWNNHTMLSTSQTSPHARQLIARRTIAATNSLSHTHQRRKYWLWNSQHQCVAQQDARKRLRIHYYRSAETLNRYLSWDNAPRNDANKTTFQTDILGFVNSEGNSSTQAIFAASYSQHFGSSKSSSLNDKKSRQSRRTKNQTSNPLDSSSISAAELRQYTPTGFDNPNISPDLTTVEKPKEYNDLAKYRPVEWNEPNSSSPSVTTEEASKQYKDLSSYEKYAVEKNATTSTAAESYNDLDKYKGLSNYGEGAVENNPTTSTATESYKDLDEYKAVSWNEPDGVAKDVSEEATAEETTKEYTNLNSYSPVSWNELNGLCKPTGEEKSKNYDDLTTYDRGFIARDSLLKAQEKAEMDATPKGIPLAFKENTQLEDPSKEYKDLGEYGTVNWNEPDGLQLKTTEEQSKAYEDLDKYRQYDNTGPKTEPVHAEEASKEYQDLGKYDQFPNSGSALHPSNPEVASKEYQDLDKYNQSPSSDPAIDPISPEIASKQYHDLSKYASNGVEETENVHPKELTKSYKDLHQYQPGNFDSYNRSYPQHSEAATKAYTDLHKYKADISQTKPTSQVDSVAAGLREFDILSKAKTDAAFAATTPRQQSSAGFHSEAIADVADATDAEMSSMDESFPSEKTHATLHNSMSSIEKAEAEHDPYSKSPQGLETSYARECVGNSTQPVHERHHKNPEPSTETSQYKILAYDATTKSISFAEASSSATDTSSPSSPAEAILHLKNPSKFFPYFAALEEQGYEIVSGGGDVLIFKKVRQGSNTASFSSIPRRKRSTGKRVILGTAGIAGSAYAISVLGEYFSTAGF